MHLTDNPLSADAPIRFGWLPPGISPEVDAAIGREKKHWLHHHQPRSTVSRPSRLATWHQAVAPMSMPQLVLE
jgi:hypothetical protein